jgi:hypothetical protein
MPPRYAYWTILIDGQPTAFRSSMQEELMPTFKRLKEKHPSAEMKWFQNGKLWDSRIDAQESMRERGDRGRMGDSRQGGFRARERFGSPRPQNLKTSRPPRGSERPEWKPRTQDSRPRPAKLDWKPKGEFTPAPKRSDPPGRPEWKPRGADRPRTGGKPEWKPKAPDRERAPRRERLEWAPKSQAPGSKAPEKRKWVPKAEYQKAKGIERPRDSKWRPGGEHRDPRQKYKDAKKAKWTKFKQNVRQRWEKKQGKKKGEE